MNNWSDDPLIRAGSLPAWWKPADLGSNPSAPISLDWFEFSVYTFNSDNLT